MVMRRIVTLALFSLLLLAARGIAAPDPRLVMRLIPLPGSDVISAYEPVVMLVQTTNVSAAGVSLPAWTTQYTMRIDIRDGQGKVVAGLPKLLIPANFLHSVYQLKPGETLESVLIISALYAFSTPGAYTVELQQFDISRANPQSVLSAKAVVTVQPFDAARLQASIERVQAEMRTTALLGRGVKTLYTLRHNLAIPALAGQVRNSGDAYAARALRRLGTPEALQALRELNAEGGRVAKAVHNSVGEMRPPNAWDLTGEDARVLPAPVPPVPAPPPVVKEPALALIDVPTNRTLFTLDDLIRFDWDRQIVQLTRERAMDLLALRVLTREFRLMAGAETIYHGGFYSPISSIIPRGPIITLGPLADAEMKVKPPLFKIEKSYIKDEEDRRFSPALREILEKVEKLGRIDLAAVPPIQRFSTEWYREQGLNVRADIFPETFTPDTPARIHLWFEPGYSPPLPATIEIVATVEDKEYHRSTVRINAFTQIQQIDSAFIVNAKPMVTAGPPGPTRMMLEIRGYREADGQVMMTHWIITPWKHVYPPEGVQWLETVPAE